MAASCPHYFPSPWTRTSLRVSGAVELVEVRPPVPACASVRSRNHSIAGINGVRHVVLVSVIVIEQVATGWANAAVQPSRLVPTPRPVPCARDREECVRPGKRGMTSRWDPRSCQDASPWLPWLPTGKAWAMLTQSGHAMSTMLCLPLPHTHMCRRATRRLQTDSVLTPRCGCSLR